jgi:RimJ/RimL family protein N-acetyltransferase/ABC-type transporter Mla MlaB component
MAVEPEAELVFHEALTSLEAPAFCRAVRERLATPPARLWINLEDVKVADVAGPAALLQVVRFCQTRGVRVSILPSPMIYRALLTAGILEELPLEGPGAGPAVPAPVAPREGLSEQQPPPLLARGAQLGLRPPTWEELEIFETWAKDPRLDQMVGSQLLFLCRHRGPYHPDFVACAMHDPTALTFLVQPLVPDAKPVGFIRLFNVNLAERFAFLETGIVDPRSLRAGWGIQASRLALAWAMDALEIHRVEAKVYAYNVLSVNSLRRNGFQQEGVLREAKTYRGRRWDILVFAILADEMRAQRAQETFPYMGFWRPDDRP